MLRNLCCVTLYVIILAIAADIAAGAKPTSTDALKLVPVQTDVDFDRPTGAEAERCSVEVEAIGGMTGWVVKTDSGQVLRRFLDTNGDNKVDQWCYFKDGIETYRDIDGNFNNKADQYRWLGTAGMRWGVDEDENLRIDRWKSISAEETTAEIVAASARSGRRPLPARAAHGRRAENARPERSANEGAERQGHRRVRRRLPMSPAGRSSSRPNPNGSISARAAPACFPREPTAAPKI